MTVAKKEKVEKEKLSDFSGLPDEVIKLIATFIPKECKKKEFVDSETAFESAQQQWKLPREQFFETSAKTQTQGEIQKLFEKAAALYLQFRPVYAPRRTQAGCLLQ